MRFWTWSHPTLWRTLALLFFYLALPLRLLRIKLRHILDQHRDFVDCLLQQIQWAEVAQLFRRRSAFPQSQ
jgi:hypothetical protein